MILDDEGLNPIEKPHLTYLWFLWSALPCFFLAFLYFRNYENSAIDIQVHDTYYVIAIYHVQLFFALLMLFYGVTYFLLNYFLIKKLNKILSIIHFLLTIFPYLIITCLTFSKGVLFVSTTLNNYMGQNLTFTLIGLCILFLLGQVIFLFNFFRSFFISLYSK